MIESTEIFKGLAQNFILYSLLTLCYSRLKSFFPSAYKSTYPLLNGIAFAFMTCVGMLAHIEVLPGKMIDGSLLMVGFSAAYGGPLSVMVTAFLVCLFRLYLGGGVLIGCAGIVGACLTGMLFHYVRKPGNVPFSPITLLLLGACLTAQAQLSAVFLLPVEMVWPILQRASGPAFIFYPVGSLMVGSIIHYATGKERRIEERLTSVLDNLDALVYVADMNTHEILFLNQYGREQFGNHAAGGKCWEILQRGQTGPCDFCTNKYLINEDGNPTAGAYKWEYRNTLNKRWYLIRDKAIQWFDGRLVRLEIATDITERKQVEEEKTVLIDRLQEAMTEVETLRGILPLCAYCNKVRDGEGKWEKLDRYVSRHFFRDISHGICPGCMKEHYPEEYAAILEERKNNS